MLKCVTKLRVSYLNLCGKISQEDLVLTYDIELQIYYRFKGDFRITVNTCLCAIKGKLCDVKLKQICHSLTIVSDARVQIPATSTHPMDHTLFPGKRSEPRSDASWKRCGQATNWSELAIASIGLHGGAFCVVYPTLGWHTGSIWMHLNLQLGGAAKCCGIFSALIDWVISDHNSYVLD